MEYFPRQIFGPYCTLHRNVRHRKDLLHAKWIFEYREAKLSIRLWLGAIVDSIMKWIVFATEIDDVVLLTCVNLKKIMSIKYLIQTRVTQLSGAVVARRRILPMVCSHDSLCPQVTTPTTRT